jgi:hypothetical protein
MCHSEPPTGLSLIGQIGEVRNPYRDVLQGIAAGISRREVYPEVLKGSSKLQASLYNPCLSRTQVIVRIRVYFHSGCRRYHYTRTALLC